MKKVLFVVNTAAFFASHRLPIAQQLIEEGYEVHLASSGKTLPIFDLIGLHFHRLEFSRKGMRPLSELRVIWQLYKLFSGLQPDIVHLVTIKPYLYGGVAAKLAKVPIVVSAVSGLGFVWSSMNFKAKFLRSVLYPLYKFAFSHKNQFVIFQNVDDADILANWEIIDSSKVHLIRGSGVDLNAYQYIAEPKGKVVVTFVARLLEDKGIRDFINASRILHNNGVNVDFWVVGDRDDGNPVSITKAEMLSWNELPNVKVFGFQTNIADLYSQSNIACLPSYREGLPKSLIEAAACGRVVVTTDVPGCREAIEPNETGLLVPMNNAEALADTIQYLIDNPDVRKKMGAAGRLLAEKEFDINKIVLDHIKIYQKLLNKVEISGDTSGFFASDPIIKSKLMFVVNVDWFFMSHRLPIALEAIRQGYEVHIATALTDRLTLLQSHGLVVHPLSLHRNSASFWSAGKTVWQIFRIFKLVNPDVVHLVTIKPVLLGGLAARLAGVPSVVAAVSGLGFVFVAKGIVAYIRRQLVSLLYAFALGHHNLRVIFQNPNDLAVLSKLVHLPNRKVSMIRGSGVDLSEYLALPLPTGAPIVLFAARLLIDKGVREFVQSAQILCQRGLLAKNTRFVIVGEPDLDNPSSLQSDELAKWADEGKVELWGHRSDMAKVIAASHIVVLPSYYGEGLPKVLIEAAACGRAVVTTDHPGCRDAIYPGVSGVLVPLQDAVSLADAIQKLLKNPVQCAAMGQAGRELAELKFDVREVVATHLQIYKELIDK